ncbi:polysaccharide biosynthesis/export family protein [Novosphingobium sediminicola]|uniref:Polysaccharide export outer membrane protein n=1 Tax=Novosphingobium sediminicola TaxID=563162 RepID=A0A7W6CP60_9SPHN|nr:polysaccharide biosynthesis/export family protein [Novosphingobium sediminicola]MBB3955102.1 polysaccharide export outer membrane protein [Novosphingobium sediminicola]
MNRMSVRQLVAVLPMMLGACATLPVSGPTGRQVMAPAVGQEGQKGQEGKSFRIVAVDSQAALPVAPVLAGAAGDDGAASPTDMIGPGDMLDIQIYEAGVSLFAGTRPTAATINGAAQAERLPAMRVDDRGEIFVPFIGRMRAGGMTSTQLAGAIRGALKGLSQNPQVVVGIAQSVTNSVILGGEVARPGRLVLTSNRETLPEVIALSGGYRGEAKDLAVQVTRGAQAQEFRLAEAMQGAARDWRIRPGDQIEIIKKPQTFAVLGAAGRVEQLPFSAPSVSLAEALSAAGGPNPNLGDAKAVFIFRFDAGGAGGAEVPTVYHINMMNPGSVFLAQRFAMRDKDVLYIGNAAANQPGKLIQLISQLFSPIIAVQGALVNTGVVR